MKTFYFDVETTGLSPWKNAIWQLAYIIEVDGEVVLERNLKAYPEVGQEINAKALQIGGITEIELAEFPLSQVQLHKALVSDLYMLCDKFDPTDKYLQVAYSGHFDVGFLQALFKNSHDKFYGSWFNHKLVDPLVLVRAFELCGKLKGLKNHKLVTVCEHFGIPLDAHDALSDINATKTLLWKLLDQIKEFEESDV